MFTKARALRFYTRRTTNHPLILSAVASRAQAGSPFNAGRENARTSYEPLASTTLLVLVGSPPALWAKMVSDSNSTTALKLRSQTAVFQLFVFPW